MESVEYIYICNFYERGDAVLVLCDEMEWDRWDESSSKNGLLRKKNDVCWELDDVKVKNE